MLADINIVYSKDKNGIYLNYYNFGPPIFLKNLPDNTCTGKSDYDLFSPKIAKLYQQQDQEVMAANHPITYQIAAKTNPLCLRVIKQPLYDDSGNIIGIMANINNSVISQVQYAKESKDIKKLVKETTGHQPPDNVSIVESVQYLRDYLENIIALMPGHVYWLDKNSVYLGCNNLQAYNVGLKSRKELIGKTNYDIISKEQADEIVRFNNKVMASGEPHTGEEYADVADGPGVFLSQKVPLRDPQGNVIGIVGISFEITDRKKAEAEQLNLVLKASNMGTWSWDFIEDTFTHEYLHHEEPYCFKGTSTAAIACAHPADREQLRQAMLRAYQEGDPLDIEYRLNWSKEKIRYIAMRGKVVENKQGTPTQMVGVSWDITARKALEQVFYQQQIDAAQIARLNAMGELASTLAHELNQPLATISNYLKGSIIRIKNGNYQAEELLNAMEQAANQSARAGEIIHRMKNFVRKGKLYYETTDLNAIIHDTVELIRYEPVANLVAIQLELTKELPKLELDKIQISQVILNLLRNAAEALQQNNINNPQIIVKSCLVENQILVDVIDNGPGCPPDLNTKLFTPYFTTKKTGTGMGLAICRTIIEAHEGAIKILPTPNSGAWFRFSLPLIHRNS